MALSAAREGALLPGRKGDRVRLEERGPSKKHLLLLDSELMKKDFSICIILFQLASGLSN